MKTTIFKLLPLLNPREENGVPNQTITLFSEDALNEVYNGFLKDISNRHLGGFIVTVDEDGIEKHDYFTPEEAKNKLIERLIP